MSRLLDKLRTLDEEVYSWDSSGTKRSRNLYPLMLDALEAYNDIAGQARCGCKHPACRNCWRDEELNASLSALQEAVDAE